LLGNRPAITLAVVADNDRADPTHEGARQFARTLKADLGCCVKLVKLTGDVKDVREYHMLNPIK
jgi:hypothetical protein